jgi:hypothetical protein
MNFELWEGLWVMIVEGIEKALERHGEGIMKAWKWHEKGLNEACCCC